jgi:hypothetical protein
MQGRSERDKAYQPMIAALEKHFADLSPDDRIGKKVLVPGLVTSRYS